MQSRCPWSDRGVTSLEELSSTWTLLCTSMASHVTLTAKRTSKKGHRCELQVLRFWVTKEILDPECQPWRLGSLAACQPSWRVDLTRADAHAMSFQQRACFTGTWKVLYGKVQLSRASELLRENVLFGERLESSSYLILLNYSIFSLLHLNDVWE